MLVRQVYCYGEGIQISASAGFTYGGAIVTAAAVFAVIEERKSV